MCYQDLCADLSKVEIIRIQDTLHLKNLTVSECLAKRLFGLPGIRILGKAEVWAFDESDNVINCW